VALGAAAVPAAPRGLSAAQHPGAYPERAAAPEPLADRFVAAVGYRWHALRGRPLAADFAAQAERNARSFRGGALASDVAGLRYALRRDGFGGELAARAVGFAAARLPQGAAPHVLGAAGVLVRGGIVQLADPAERRQALTLAALARALQGAPVHWLTSAEAKARAAGEALRGLLAELGLPADAVRCAPLREVAFDYLRDRLQLGARARPLRGAIERLAGDAPPAARLKLAGLHCALVEDADLLMLDDVMAPLVMTAEADLSGERLVYEQAAELARALAAGSDFEAGDEGVRLTPEGARRLAQLSVLLGPVWSLRARREELVSAALAAQHLGRDPARRSDVLLRMTVARFLSRYLHLAGACADARGIEDDFWALYALRTVRAGPAPARFDCPVRVFRTTAQRRAAVLQIRRDPALIALRTKEEAEAMPDGLATTLYPAHRTAQPPPGPPVHLVVAELHDSRRHLAQMRDAYGAASCEMLLALEDKGVDKAMGSLAKTALRLEKFENELPPAVARRAAAAAQAGAERAQSSLRRELVARERQFDELLAFSGRRD
jgi:preprotein translocase subunit SecA